MSHNVTMASKIVAPKCVNSGGWRAKTIQARDNTTIITTEGDEKTFAFGHGNDKSKETAAVPSEVTIVSIANGDEHSILLDDRGCVWAMGDNTNHQCGIEGEPFIVPARPLNSFLFGDSDVVAVSAGANHSAVVTAAGSVYTFGLNTSCQCGLEECENLPPTLVEYLAEDDLVAVNVECGGDFTLVIMSNNAIYSAGDNTAGQCGITATLGDSSRSPMSTMASPRQRGPTLMSPLMSPLGLGSSMGGPHPRSPSMNGPGYLRSPGMPVAGHLRSPSMTGSLLMSPSPRRSPGGFKVHIPPPPRVDIFTQIMSIPDCSAVACGHSHVVMLAATGDLWVWGSDQLGQISFDIDEELLTAINNLPIVWHYDDDMGLIAPEPEPEPEPEPVEQTETTELDTDSGDESETSDTDDSGTDAMDTPRGRGKGKGKDAKRRRRKIAPLEIKKSTKAPTKAEGFKMGAKDPVLMAKLAKLKKIAKQLAKLDRAKMAELKTYNIPPPYAHEVVRAFLMTLGHSPKKVKTWESCRVMIGSNMVIQAARFDPSKKPDKPTCRQIMSLIGGFDDEKVEEESMIALLLMTWVKGALSDEFDAYYKAKEKKAAAANA